MLPSIFLSRPFTRLLSDLRRQLRFCPTYRVFALLPSLVTGYSCNVWISNALDPPLIRPLSPPLFFGVPKHLLLRHTAFSERKVRALLTPCCAERPFLCTSLGLLLPLFVPHLTSLPTQKMAAVKSSTLLAPFALLYFVRGPTGVDVYRPPFPPLFALLATTFLMVVPVTFASLRILRKY